MANFKWTDFDVRAVNTAKVLAADAVEQVGNGHPGTAISLAPAAYLLFQKFIKHNPKNPNWIGRDRFILSPGHTSLTLYVQLFLSGYELNLHDLKNLRTWGSKTPGHPEYKHTAGVEITTGPLGQGLASAVGFAYSQRRLRGMLDAESKPGESVFDHTIWVIASDGDLQEGVTAEASSLAGHQELGNLVVLYDDNHISIENDTKISYSENVLQRYESYGWHVQKVDWYKSGNYVEDIQSLSAALTAAKAETKKPSIIALRTIIAWPCPTKQNTGKVHGSALGKAELGALKQKLNFDPNKNFYVEEEVFTHTSKLVDKGVLAEKVWEEKFAIWAKNNPERNKFLQRINNKELPENLQEILPIFEPGVNVSTRAASGVVINALADVLPELWGGSADLAESNNTTIIGAPSFIPESKQTDSWSGNQYGRVLHFGIREHAAAAIVNGIVLHGATRAFCGTFLVFSDYQRPAIRLAALMGLPAIFVWTHDSIGLGEDGPTHQPVEHLASLRAIPNFDVVRPADANEVAWAWKTILERQDKPAGIVLSRQSLPVYERGQVLASAKSVQKGGYVLAEATGGVPKVIIIATGSEVQIALEARDELQLELVPTRVVSMPCLEWFKEQPLAYQNEVLPPSVMARVSVEAGVSQCWQELVGSFGVCVSLEHYGASADQQTLYEKFGFTAKATVAAAHKSLLANKA